MTTQTVRTGKNHSTHEWLVNLGGMLRAHRVGQGHTQVEMARLAGVGQSTLQHLEAGDGATLTTLVKVVRALGAEEWLSALAPPAEPTVSPMQLLRQQQSTPPNRRRVRRSRSQPSLP
jgi:transcriptional regulator with XRE-family HTH domain